MNTNDFNQPTAEDAWFKREKFREDTIQRRKSFLEMARQRKDIMDSISRQNLTISRHLIKLRLLDMGDLNYGPLKNSWRREIATHLENFQSTLAKGSKTGFLSPTDYFTALYIQPYTDAVSYTPNAVDCIDQLQRRIRGTRADVSYENQKNSINDRFLRPLILRDPSLQEVEAMLKDIKSLLWEISQGLSEGIYESVQPAIELLKERGF